MEGSTAHKGDPEIALQRVLQIIDTVNATFGTDYAGSLDAWAYENDKVLNEAIPTAPSFAGFAVGTTVHAVCGGPFLDVVDYNTLFASEHEYSHVVLNESWGRSPAFLLREGAAHFVGDGPDNHTIEQRYGQDDTLPALEASLSLTDFPTRTLGKVMVNYLLENRRH